MVMFVTFTLRSSIIALLVYSYHIPIAFKNNVTKKRCTLQFVMQRISKLFMVHYLSIAIVKINTHKETEEKTKKNKQDLGNG